MQSFMVPNDPDADFPKDGVMADAFYGDPYVRVATWLHIVPHGEDIEKMRLECLQYARRDSAHFIMMKNETFWKAYLQEPPLSRQYLWAAAMAGMHSLEAQHYANRPAHERLLRDDGLLAGFMERTDFHRMKPRDNLAAGATKWVLANPGQSYVVYSYACTGPMGLKGMTAGAYDLLWYDTASGAEAAQPGVRVAAGDASWTKPAGPGGEIALYVRRREAK